MIGFSYSSCLPGYDKPSCRLHRLLGRGSAAEATTVSFAAHVQTGGALAGNAATSEPSLTELLVCFLGI